LLEVLAVDVLDAPLFDEPVAVPLCDDVRVVAVEPLPLVVVPPPPEEVVELVMFVLPEV